MSSKLDFKKVDWGLSQCEEKFIHDIISKENKVIDYLLRNKVTPPIKGNITKRKVMYRGLTIATVQEGFNSSKYLMQRGNKVGLISETAYDGTMQGFSINISKV